MSVQIDIWKVQYYAGVYNEVYYFKIADIKTPKVIWEKGLVNLQDSLTPEEYSQLNKIEELIIKQYNLIKENDK